MDLDNKGSRIFVTQMKDGDREDYAFLTEHEIEYAAGTADRGEEMAVSGRLRPVSRWKAKMREFKSGRNGAGSGTPAGRRDVDGDLEDPQILGGPNGFYGSACTTRLVERRPRLRMCDFRYAAVITIELPQSAVASHLYDLHRRRDRGTHTQTTPPVLRHLPEAQYLGTQNRGLAYLLRRTGVGGLWLSFSKPRHSGSTCPHA
ncbi:hypothetical protein C7I87_34900 [Mesorhizobium sp. SARCC-RB16n]|nr:hypothetical protein C7I87_34900 [Mesorhizobium sp. SARCC-RB16n]